MTLPVIAFALGAALVARGPVPADEADVPEALEQMLAAERAFAARAAAVGWKQAFLEYFGEAAVGFAGGKVGSARDHVRRSPDPPPGHQLLWEPRFGDIAASGEIGYLTGPVQTIVPAQDKGRPRHAVYASVWKRQRDGVFKVLLDVAVPTPGAAAFAAGFVRAAHADRFTGEYDDTTPTLRIADEVLNSVLRINQARAYRTRLARDARFHRPNLLPIVGEQRITAWLAAQPSYSTADTQFSETARSGDLGYSWGIYRVRPRAGQRAQEGFYVRLWARDRAAQWKVAVDVLQPQ